MRQSLVVYLVSSRVWEVLDAPETIPRWGGMRGPFGVGIGNHKTDNRLVFVFCRHEQVPALIIDV